MHTPPTVDEKESARTAVHSGTIRPIRPKYLVGPFMARGASAALAARRYRWNVERTLAWLSATSGSSSA
jgi:hypothetical protein